MFSRSLDSVGRLHRLRNLRLLEYDDWLYVPQCQDPTPMTEDMLAEHAEVGVLGLMLAAQFYMNFLQSRLLF